MKVPYYDTLQSCRLFLEDYFDSFPAGKCQYASKLVSTVLDLEEVAGYYGPFGKTAWHAWSYDSNFGLYFDISLDQFDTKHNSISVLPRENKYLVEVLTETIKHQDAINFYNVSDFKDVLDAYAIYSKK